MKQLRILFEDHHLVVFEKPQGISVHPPERSRSVAGSRKNPDVIRILRNQLGKRVYPVHRLDRATQGVMVIALDSSTAGALQRQFQNREVEKEYLLLCRGWMEECGVLDSPLPTDLEDRGERIEARTEFETLHRFELPIPSGKHPTSRYSIMRALPRTGRFHQIRRHFRRVSHPLIGDSVHGDGIHNRIWREMTGDQRLYLLSWYLKFVHPLTGRALGFRGRFSGSWHKVFDRAGFCPIH